PSTARATSRPGTSRGLATRASSRRSCAARAVEATPSADPRDREAAADDREGADVIDVPAVVRNKALAVGAASWLDELPTLVASLEQDWSIVVGHPFADASEALVAEATLDDGTRAVVKVIVPRAGDAARNEITALRLTNGEGCVRLLRDDVARGALL